MARQTAYRVADFRDPEGELARLKEQASVIAEREEALLGMLGFPELGRILDLGCGPGFVAARLLARRPQLQIVGLDRDPALLANASALVEAVVGDAAALPFADASFCCVHARLVLRHLVLPERALAEAWRVLEPGGLLVVIDSDESALRITPPIPGFARAVAARHDGIRRVGADPTLAQRLPALLEGARFADTHQTGLRVASKDCGAEGFARLVLRPVVDACDADLLPRPEADAIQAAITAWTALPLAYGETTACVLTARKLKTAHGYAPLSR